MTASPAHSPRLLLIATMVLVVAGMVLLTVPQTPRAPTAPAAPRTTTPPSHPTATPGGLTAQTSSPAHATASSASTTASTRSASASALPPHGEGVAGDAVIQMSLADAWHADLAADDERKLLAAGRDLLRADATGVGRTQWPALFGDPDQALAPAFATARFRIQAAVARRDGSANRAVVHLVWAGMDRGGTYTDRRITDWHFVRTSTKGVPVWIPQPRM